MRAVDIIIKKRDKNELTREEIEYFILGYAKGEIPDYQASAWAMAVLLNGMSLREIKDLAIAMANSGELIDLSGVAPIAVDKHSTGGVGDKTTLVVGPVVAAAGLPVAKMSGRGLGFSGGTLDKLESIPGFRTNLSTAEFLKQLVEIGFVLTGQTADLAPADGKMYALRDVTGTVPSVPLIASSIMSKKIAAGAQAIVLDVKSGNGAFCETLDAARELAKTMVWIGKLTGRNGVAVISDMNQPLGFAVGNALELKEAIETLHGEGPSDFREHCLVIAGHMLALGNIAENCEDGQDLARKAISNGTAWEKFKDLVEAQGGDQDFITNTQLLPKASLIETVKAPRSGYLAEIHARIIGETAVLLGGGRAKKTDPIDYAVGILVHHKVGDYVEVGEPLFTVHANHSDRMRTAKEQLLLAHKFDDNPVDPLPLFHGVVEMNEE